MADAVAEPVAKRSRASSDDVRDAVGLVFLALTVAYLWQAGRELWAGRS